MDATIRLNSPSDDKSPPQLMVPAIRFKAASRMVSGIATLEKGVFGEAKGQHSTRLWGGSGLAIEMRNVSQRILPSKGVCFDAPNPSLFIMLIL